MDPSKMYPGETAGSAPPAYEAPPPYSPPGKPVPYSQQYPQGFMPSQPPPIPPQMGHSAQAYGYIHPGQQPHDPSQQYAMYPPPPQTMQSPAALYPQGLVSPGNYVVAAQFDAGARFNQFSAPTIPPPPPGCMPNAAQLAMMSGQPTTVIAQQKRGGFFSGSGSGGVKFW